MIKFTFIFIILYWLVVRPKRKKHIDRYITICTMLFIIMMGLRNEAIYGDTIVYVNFFREMGQTSLQNFLSGIDRDYGFWIISYYLYYLMGGVYTLWLLLIAVGFMWPVMQMIRKHSVDPMYSWIVFIFLGFMYFVMAGLRQTVAMSFVFTGILFLFNNNLTKKRKNIYFAAFVAVAFLFHGSASICIVGLLLQNRKVNGGTIPIYLLALVMSYFFGKSIMSDVTLFLGGYDERYIGYGEKLQGSNYTYFIQQLVLVVPTLYALRNRFHEPVIGMLCHFSIIGLLLISLSPVIAEMFRVSYYFSWANLILFPLAIQTFRKEASFVPPLYLLFFIVYLVFINKSVWNEYYFWFENTSHVVQQL